MIRERRYGAPVVDGHALYPCGCMWNVRMKSYSKTCGFTEGHTVRMLLKEAKPCKPKRNSGSTSSKETSQRREKAKGTTGRHRVQKNGKKPGSEAGRSLLATPPEPRQSLWLAHARFATSRWFGPTP